MRIWSHIRWTANMIADPPGLGPDSHIRVMAIILWNATRVLMLGGRHNCDVDKNPPPLQLPPMIKETKNKDLDLFQNMPLPCLQFFVLLNVWPL